MPQKREVLFEIFTTGALAKVTAVDPETGVEAVIQGPISAGVAVLKRNALQKLRFLINKEKQK
jgi:hypothetical protein